MVYKCKSAMEYATSGLCKSCFMSKWTRFNGKTHSDSVKSNQSKKVSGEGNPMFGKKHSIETVYLIKEKRKEQIITDEAKEKMSKSHKGKIVTDETKEKMSKSFKGRRYSHDTRKRMSQSRRRYFENMTNIEYENYCNKMRISHTNKLNVFPAYNKNSIPMIEEYGKKNGYNFQHAENGGEYFIKELGYWVDAYDKEKNVVLEIDEKYHFVDGRLRLEDIIRQRRIERHLNCKFIRLKYETKQR